MPDSYLDLAIKRQALLERIKTGLVRDYGKELKKVEKLIRQTLNGLEEDLPDLSRTELNKLLRALQTDQGAIFAAATDAFLVESADVAALYATHEIMDLEATVDLRGTKLNKFTKKKLYREVLNRPLSTDGGLLKPWIKKFETTEINRINNAIRQAHSQGLTNRQAVQKIIGTKSKNFKDGIMQTTRRNASTIVRTSTQHVASSARQEVWEANRDVVDKYQWVSTLDSDTSRQCRSLDGQIFDFGKGPIPPIHPNCRSSTIAVLNSKYKFLSKGRTRSSQDGPVRASTNYYDWLKRQPKSVQVEVLGTQRAKLFQEMNAERFRELQFDRNFEPLTLDEMRVLEPEAFERAGI